MGQKISKFEDLEVWKEGMNLAEEIGILSNEICDLAHLKLKTDKKGLKSHD